MTEHEIRDRQISVPPAGFEPAIPVGERLQTHAIKEICSREIALPSPYIAAV